MLEIGKIPNDLLKSMILSRIKRKRNEVVLRPDIGEDCCAIDFEQELCVMSTDPITGTENEVGRLAVHVSCNDLAASGAEPLGIMTTILVPPNSKKEQLERVVKQISNIAAGLNIDIVGGHTEVTDAVTRFVVSVTAIGKIPKGKLITTSGAKPGNDLVMTKYAGMEGTSILAFEHSEELAKKFGSFFVTNAKKLILNISVVKEGLIAAKAGATAMHDATEGGVYGAIWEISKASNCGVEVEKSKIPVLNETMRICNHFNISPYQLISSGCMLIACENGADIVNKLDSKGIPAAIIGKFTESKSRLLMTESGGVFIPAPKGDELYKIKRKQKGSK